MIQTSNIRGILSILTAGAALVANDTCMKLALAHLPPLEVLVLRGTAACLWCLPTLLILGQGRALHHVLDRFVLLRCGCEVVAIICFIYALQNMPIADTTAIVQTSPILVLIGTSLIWGDRIGPVRVALICGGITGALMVIQPGSDLASPYALWGLATAVAGAGRDIVSRRVNPGIPVLIVAFATLITVMLAALAGSLATETMVMPGWREAALMAAAGLFVMGGHFFLYLAYKLARARVVAPFNYAFTVWAVLSGLIVFGDLPNTLALAGMALIILSGLAITLFEGRVRTGTASREANAQVISN